MSDPRETARLERTTLADGFTVAAAVFGSGRPLVYLPGFPDLFSVAAEPLAFHRRLAAAGRVYAVAPPGALGEFDAGFGGLRTVEDLLFRYRWWLDQAGLGRVHLAGHSWGAWLALEFACWFPERVESLALVAPLGLDLAQRQLPDIFRLSQPADGFGRRDLRRLLFADADSAVARETFPDAPLPLEEEMRRVRALRFMALIGWRPAFFFDRDLPGRARRFRGRALVVSGECDAFTGPEYGEACSRLLGAAHVVLPGCGHAAVVEAPEALAGAVLAFLGSDAEPPA